VPFFPQCAVRAQFGRCAIHGYACHVTDTALIDHQRGLQVCYTTLVGVSTYFKSITHVLRMPYRINAVLPSMRRPGAIRALRHPWLRLSRH